VQLSHKKTADARACFDDTKSMLCCTLDETDKQNLLPILIWYSLLLLFLSFVCLFILVLCCIHEKMSKDVFSSSFSFCFDF